MIYATKDITIADEDVEIDELPEVALYSPPHLSPRIPAQQSLFTVHKRPDRIFRPKHVVKLVIRCNQLDFKYSLNACGVNRASLFPDIDGLADQRSWLYKWGNLREEFSDG